MRRVCTCKESSEHKSAINSQPQIASTVAEFGKWELFIMLFLKGGFTILRMSMNQNTFWPLLAMTQTCLI